MTLTRKLLISLVAALALTLGTVTGPALAQAPSAVALANDPAHGSDAALQQEVWEEQQGKYLSTPTDPPAQDSSWYSGVIVAALGVFCLLICWT